MYDIAKLPVSNHHLMMRNEASQANSTKLIRQCDAPLTSIKSKRISYEMQKRDIPCNTEGLG